MTHSNTLVKCLRDHYPLDSNNMHLTCKATTMVCAMGHGSLLKTLAFNVLHMHVLILLTHDKGKSNAETDIGHPEKVIHG